MAITEYRTRDGSPRAPRRQGRTATRLALIVPALVVFVACSNSMSSTGAGEQPAPSELSSRISSVNEALATLTMVCAPTSEDAETIEIALAQLVSDLDTGVSPRGGVISATATERELLVIAHQLSQVLAYVFDQYDALAQVLFAEVAQR